jgi:hypothetical protein
LTVDGRPNVERTRAISSHVSLIDVGRYARSQHATVGEIGDGGVVEVEPLLEDRGVVLTGIRERAVRAGGGVGEAPRRLRYDAVPTMTIGDVDERSPLLRPRRLLDLFHRPDDTDRELDRLEGELEVVGAVE